MAATTTSGETATTMRPASSTAPVAKKLLLKPGNRIALVNAPQGYAQLLEPLPEGAQIVESVSAREAAVDVVQLFVNDEAELRALSPAAFRAVKPSGMLWISYRKGGVKAGSDLHRDTLHTLVREMGWEGVSLVAIDDTWSAMRFKRV